MTDAEHVMRSMVDHPAGTAVPDRPAPGRHRKPDETDPYTTPADVLEHNRAWQVAQGIMFGIGALGVVLLVLVAAVTVFRAVIGPW
ncbi:hypothetical protein [Corynebacterium sp. AOP12-C2-36]|uniref:hypothetical protein n=1 Tax=Corynebacterium sp. AOP12-C2-36 TaxID=3457723 RepID=UPI0040345708